MANVKRVINVDTKQVYECARDADKQLGLKLGSVTRGIKGNYRVNGHRWQLKSDYDNGIPLPEPKENLRFKGHIHNKQSIAKMLESRSKKVIYTAKYFLYVRELDRTFKSQKQLCEQLFGLKDGSALSSAFSKSSADCINFRGFTISKVSKNDK